MSEHTPEPWKAFVRRSGGRYTIAVQADGCPDVVSWPGFDDSNRSYREHAANARRIVACVNACEGSDPEAEQIAILTAERDALREVLEELVLRCDGEQGVRADGSNIQTMRAHHVLDREDHDGEE